MKPMEETTLLKFAAGELTADEEANFLASCEIAPENWRAAALAVVEHRRMVEALGEWAADESAAPRQAKAKPSLWRTMAVAGAALAAGLLLGVGMMRATGFGTGSGSQIAKTPPAAPVAPRPETQTKEPSGGPAVHEVANDTATPIPVELLRTAPSLSDSQRAVLGKHGFRVEEEPTVYIINAGNGTRWAVPTQRTTLHYVKR